MWSALDWRRKTLPGFLPSYWTVLSTWTVPMPASIIGISPRTAGVVETSTGPLAWMLRPSGVARYTVCKRKLQQQGAIRLREFGTSEPQKSGKKKLPAQEKFTANVRDIESIKRQNITLLNVRTKAQ